MYKEYTFCDEMIRDALKTTSNYSRLPSPLLFLGYSFRGKKGNPTPWKTTSLESFVVAPIPIEALLINTIDLPKKYQTTPIHETLNFQGTILLDSGGYQYLSKNITPNPKEVIQIQEQVSPDLIVPLDRPIPKHATLTQRKKSIQYSLNHNIQWMNHFGENRVLPVIHGMTLRELEFQMTELSEPKQVGIGSIVPVLMYGQRKNLIKLLYEFRMLYPKTWIHVFGVSYGIANLFFYLGINSVDTASWLHNARYGSIHLPGTGARAVARKTNGSKKGHKKLTKQEWEKAECKCSVCRLPQAWNLLSLWGVTGHLARGIHNAYVYQESVAQIRQAILANQLEKHLEQVFKHSSLKYLANYAVQLKNQKNRTQYQLSLTTK